MIKFDALDLELICHIILAACVMHNLCVRNHDEPTGELEELEDLNAALPRPFDTWEQGSRREDKATRDVFEDAWIKGRRK